MRSWRESLLYMTDRTSLLYRYYKLSFGKNRKAWRSKCTKHKRSWNFVYIMVIRIYDYYFLIIF